MSRPPGIFISYRRIDTNWAAVALRHRLSRELPGANVFMDITGIAPGDDFREVINQQVDQCDILLAFIGANWLTVSDNAGRRRLDQSHDFVRLEISRALEQSMTILPILIDDAPMPSAEALPEALSQLAYRNAMQIRHNSHERDSGALCDFLADEFPEARESAPVPAPQPTVAAPDDVGEAVAAALLDAGVDAKTMLSVAQMRYEAGKHREEYAIRTAAQPRLVNDEGEYSDWALSNRHYMASAKLELGNAIDAERDFAELLQLREQVQSREHPDAITTRHELASAKLRLGKAAEAEAEFSKVVKSFEKVLGADHPYTLTAKCELARAIQDQGEAALAEKAFTALLPVLEKVQGMEHPDTLKTRIDLAQSKFDQGEVATSAASFRTLLQIVERVLGAENFYTHMARRALALALLELGETTEAKAMLELLTEDEGDLDPGERGRTYLLSGFLADLEGRAADAEAHLNKAEAALAHLEPEHYIRRELAQYRKTRVPGDSGGTTLWMLDQDS